MVLLLASAFLTCVASSDPLTGQRPTDATPGQTAATTAKIRIELQRLGTGHASDFFESLQRTLDAGNRDRLSREQAGLIRRLDHLGRDVLRIWLTRVLQVQPRSLTIDQLERAKARLLGNVEAIAREAVLSPAQARKHRDSMTVPALRPLTGRYPRPAPTVSGVPPPDTLARARNEIWCDAVYLGRRGEPAASELFASLLFGDKGAVPGLTPEQTALAATLEVLSRDVQREWLLRGIGKEPPPKESANDPPTPEMLDRVSDRGWKLRASVVAHAEEILLEAVLNAAQSEAAKRRSWASGGVFALSDAELAARLRLSGGQREEIAALIQGRAAVFHEVHTFHVVQMSEAAAAERSGRISGEQRLELEIQERKGLDRNMSQYDQSVWELLSPGQLRALRRLLRKPEAALPAPKPKGASRSG